MEKVFILSLRILDYAVKIQKYFNIIIKAQATFCVWNSYFWAELLLGLCTSLDPDGTRWWSPSFGSCKKNDHHIFHQSFLVLFALDWRYIIEQEKLYTQLSYYVTMICNENYFYYSEKIYIFVFSKCCESSVGILSYSKQFWYVHNMYLAAIL